MKIGLNAHLLSGQAGYRAAGIHSYIANLLSHLPKQAPADWQFEAMVGAGNPGRMDGVHVSRAAFDTSRPWRRILWEQLIQPGRLHRYDLYHAMAFVAPLALRAPMVVTVYDLSFLRYPERLSPTRRAYLRHFTALTCRRARRILAISRSTAADLSALLDVPAGKIDVTPLGYDREIFRPLPAAELERFRRSKDLPQRFWLFIGTLEPRKNLPILLEAYADLPRSLRQPLILGGGVGWMADEVFAAIERLDLAREVQHIGFIPVADLPLWYNCAELFLYPSLYEGFGLPVLEAMACGAPVITSDSASLPEVAGEAGYCLPARDRAAWSGALASAAQDAAWRAAATAAGLQRAGRFSWARTAKLTLASYHKALGAREPSAAEYCQPASGSD